MSRNDKTEPPLHVELIPSPATLVRERSGKDEAELERLVLQKVAEIMADRDALVFEPFFRSRQVAYELKRLQSVPEQRKFSIYFERYGCMKCDAKDRIHAGNGMCPPCRARFFARLAQIIAEGIKGEPARPATGTLRVDRLLPANGPRDGVHRTWYERDTTAERDLHDRIAKQLGVGLAYVRRVARGQSRSDTVSAALKQESERIQQSLNGGGE